MKTAGNSASANLGLSFDFGVGILLALSGGAMATPWLVHHFGSGAAGASSDIYSICPVIGIAGLLVCTILFRQNRKIQALEARLTESLESQVD